MANQLMPPLDAEMAEFVHRRLKTRAHQLQLSDAVSAFEACPEGGLIVRTKKGGAFPADIVILAIGVRPETSLAKNAGLQVGLRGGIHVDNQMRTSDPNIWAIGDAVETRSVITGTPEMIPLAGPANRQGRIAAEAIAGRDSRYRGLQGTAVCGFFGLVVAMTGATERSLKRAGMTDFQAVYLHPGHHVDYYPGAKPIHFKLLFNPRDGRILGAQAVGEEGVERRVDVIAMAMQMCGTVFDLEEAELCYAPQYGAAKDPVNVCGMVAANVVRGDVQLANWNDLPNSGALILDVRDPGEFQNGSIDGAINIPLGQLRDRLNELPRDKEIWINCGVGQRAYYACRLLAQRGFKPRNLSGGYESYRAFYPAAAGH
jgi:rhodanese-related sulfurtransferase